MLNYADLNTAEKIRNIFYDNLLSRFASGQSDLCFNFTFPISTFNRVRVSSSFITDIIEYFQSNGFQIEYHDFTKAFSLSIHITNCVFTPDEAQYYDLATKRRSDIYGINE